MNFDLAIQPSDLEPLTDAELFLLWKDCENENAKHADIANKARYGVLVKALIAHNDEGKPKPDFTRLQLKTGLRDTREWLASLVRTRETLLEADRRLKLGNLDLRLIANEGADMADQFVIWDNEHKWLTVRERTLQAALDGNQR